MSSGQAKARAVAFYLPQFHPVPQNDEWWGAGFTEWTNVAKARPLFPGHRQPLLPSELGYYDLRVPETRQQQSDLAQEYGVEAFCYWHYWFGDGRRILERPFAEVVASQSPGVSFCLGWANQTWTGIWHGAKDRVLMEQRYPGADDDEAHFAAIVDALRDERYLRVDDRPVFYVFRPEELPHPAQWVDRWQRMARAAGLPGLYLVAEVSDLLGRGVRYTRHQADGFDAGVYMRLPADTSPSKVRVMRVLRKLRRPEIYPYRPTPYDYPSGLNAASLQPCVYPNWDNTPRSGRNGLVLTGASPERFRAHLRDAVEKVSEKPPGERLVWIKSWNEWAEGNHLEPDRREGRRWLEAVRCEVLGDS